MIRSIKFSVFGISDGAHVETSRHDRRNVNIPDICPRCGCAVSPIVLHSVAVATSANESSYVVILFCQHCYQPFVATFSDKDFSLISVLPKSDPQKSFDQKLCNLSPGFVKTYNQALTAEVKGLDELAGMGYRRALEFLIKDYLIYRNQECAESIKRDALGVCIANRINNDRLRSASRSATWLGNDFTHYERRYDGYEINHLKQFIDATVFWILMELTTDEAANMDRR